MEKLTTTVIINQNQDGTFFVKVMANTYLHGTRISKTKSKVASKSQALLLAGEFEKDLQERFKNESGLRVSRVLDLYYENGIKFDKFSETTKVELSKRIIPRLKDGLGKYLATDLNNDIVEDFCLELSNTKAVGKETTLKKGTVVRHYRVLQAAMNFAFRKGLLPYNRVKYVQIKEDKEDFEPNFLSAEQLGNILKEIKFDYNKIYIPVLLCTTLGLRRGEAIGLKWENVDFAKMQVKIKDTVTQSDEKVFYNTTTKTKRIRYIAMSEFLAEALLEHKAELEKVGIDSPYVCMTIWDEELLEPKYLTKAFNKFNKKANGLKVRIQDLRASFSQIGYENEIDDETRARILGHSDSKTTQRFYTGFSNKQEKKAMDLISDIIKQHTLN